ncbi:MAG: prephenate dehydrogenase [Clostridia bacterium]|nr:prephenate dehydrogenase [Clostridia bacterium]
MANNDIKSLNFGDLKVSIIGLGLIGGSLARALRERLGVKDITAVNRNLDSIKEAIKDGTIARGFDEVNEYVWESDIIFICTPVKRTLQYIDELAGKVKKDCIITDVGSTKAEIIQFVNQLKAPPQFIGGHPMAGAEKVGYSASFSHLFENAFYILSPCISTGENAIQLMTELTKGIGAIPIVLDSEDHDRITAGISHVPHVIASTLVNLVKELDSESGKMQLLAAGGFKDITRIASSSPEMWENIVLSNKKQVCEILNQYVRLINEFKESIHTEDSLWIYDAFESAKIYRDSFSSNVKGPIASMHEVIVDVVDKPGIIGKIATLLGNHNVNIKNINVSNSREFEQGCLRITLSDAESANIAFDLLINEGYKVYKRT